MSKKPSLLEISEEEMRTYGYKVVDAVVNHFCTKTISFPLQTQPEKKWTTYF